MFEQRLLEDYRTFHESTTLRRPFLDGLRGILLDKESSSIVVVTNPYWSQNYKARD